MHESIFDDYSFLKFRSLHLKPYLPNDRFSNDNTVKCNFARKLSILHIVKAEYLMSKCIYMRNSIQQT